MTAIKPATMQQSIDAGNMANAKAVAAERDALRADNARLREALRHYINVVESVNDPTTFNPRIVLVGHYARAALAKDKS